MTKKMLVSWLQSQKAMALSAVTAQREKALSAFDESAYQTVGLPAIAGKVQSLFCEAANLVEEWHKVNAEYLGDGGRYHGSIHNALYDFIKSDTATYDRMKYREFDSEAPKRREIKSAFANTLNEIEKNYANVLFNVQGLKDAKLGLEYLKELGFDLADLLAQDTAPVETALAVPIDTKYLFCGRCQK